MFERIQGETPPFADLDQDGRPELVCHWQGRWGRVEPDWVRPTEPWSFHPVTEPGDYDRFYHGTGVGVQIRAVDVTGDGAADVLAASKLGTFLFINRRRATRQ